MPISDGTSRGNDLVGYDMEVSTNSQDESPSSKEKREADSNSDRYVGPS
jgi:hypothetical protein